MAAVVSFAADRSFEKTAEQWTQCSDIADDHTDSVLCKTPDNHIGDGDGEEKVFLIGEVDRVLEPNTGGKRGPAEF
ncbi:hypothetical protein N7499_007676 [Penicillium canescens]|uniref:Uncharacterized protein n=1 Tax=Penicillium canescens TaxID=5083 RepID=A0AAD6N1I4_PENCN|nr:uncharacterized protein N7446_012713 [Penicillium canescens]KAJ5986034.1 hypothetical protein N7522_013230 [Penicillium canescens]KAJ6022360.1 hypothetical protein N7460_012755 [Penicillium canescens]KAJ6026381.1 hypothetical protein N7444_014060 [Penicillium canescens]KAJ6041647.1 hypothetical protein N7446_012713 [Penicillium canescens]KAJ6075695.1 hypothetical protein N7499_007676 [Penicillium canescens]